MRTTCRGFSTDTTDYIILYMSCRHLLLRIMAKDETVKERERERETGKREVCEEGGENLLGLV